MGIGYQLEANSSHHNPPRMVMVRAANINLLFNNGQMEILMGKIQVDYQGDILAGITGLTCSFLSMTKHS
uniref:Uncharacterized protein n=1 Tax=Rhizophora mucronata TaxID=61149 RepID=A0A2P2NZR1_RHIMU